MIKTKEEADAILKETLAGTPAHFRDVCVYSHNSEYRYLTVEAMFPCRPLELSDGQIAAMNEQLGFKEGATNYKGRDYRPYCGRCDRAPRMYRIQNGFCCWGCHHEWILETRKHTKNEN